MTSADIQFALSQVRALAHRLALPFWVVDDFEALAEEVERLRNGAGLNVVVMPEPVVIQELTEVKS